MALRLVQIFIPSESCHKVEELLEEHPAGEYLGIWHQQLTENQALVTILLSAEETDAIMDLLNNYCSINKELRIILLPVEATVPRPEPLEKPSTQPPKSEPESESKGKTSRISREELYYDITEAIKFSWTYLILVILSSIVAAVGLDRSNVTIIIGSMLIAPLLGPNVALSFATTLGDSDLARQAMKVNIMGILAAFFVSLILGFILKVVPDIPEIALRTQVGLGDIALALASGSAGALSFTICLSTVLVGVMVAVALLPPLVTCGMLFGAGYLHAAMGAFLLLVTNIICINLAGVVTFLAQGVSPITWWKADRAKKITRAAILLWCFLLSILVVVILLSQQN
jgi:uncharacterized hydrophobic protein (TIGR00341 family)